MGRDQDHPGRIHAGVLVEPPGNVEPAFASEVDVDQRDVRLEFPAALDGFGRRGGHADDRDALALEDATGGVH
jgi:hypothetical protein